MLPTQVIESYSYFSLSVAMTLYLTDEFGISDLAVRYPLQQGLYTARHPRVTCICQPVARSTCAALVSEPCQSFPQRAGFHTVIIHTAICRARLLKHFNGLMPAHAETLPISGQCTAIYTRLSLFLLDAGSVITGRLASITGCGACWRPCTVLCSADWSTGSVRTTCRCPMSDPNSAVCSVVDCQLLSALVSQRHRRPPLCKCAYHYAKPHEKPELDRMYPFPGVRTSLVVCFVLHTACRLAMAVTTSRHVLLAVLLGPETLAGALGVPVLTIGIKRFTNQARVLSPCQLSPQLMARGHLQCQQLAPRFAVHTGL